MNLFLKEQCCERVKVIRAAMTKVKGCQCRVARKEESTQFLVVCEQQCQ